MNRVELIFGVIDVLFRPLQNYIRIKGIKTEKDISYSDKDERQKMDFYYPEKAENAKMPIIINIHGGGFVKGNKKFRRSVAEMYANRGYFVINMNYRLSPKYHFPAPVEDVFSVLIKLPEIAEKYDLDLSKVVITGDSAGGYLAAMAVACLNDEGLREALELPACDIKMAGLIPFSALFNMVSVLKKKFPLRGGQILGESVTGLKLDKNFTALNDYKYLKYMSPIKYVNKNWCKTLLSYSKKDIFCKGQGEEFHEKLKEHGVECDIVFSSSIFDNHCYHFNYWTKASKETFKKVFEFLEDIKNS